MSRGLTVALSVLAFVAMATAWEGVARFTHRHVMHGFGWFLHEDHHRTGGQRFQKNDLYALFFALCSFLLIYLGLEYRLPPVWSGGFGVALYGVGYVGFHDILFHRRAPRAPPHRQERGRRELRVSLGAAKLRGRRRGIGSAPGRRGMTQAPERKRATTSSVERARRSVSRVAGPARTRLTSARNFT
jgi:hypothetical protein